VQLHYRIMLDVIGFVVEVERGGGELVRKAKVAIGVARSDEVEQDCPCASCVLTAQPVHTHQEASRGDG